jgi:hypothetical protein
VWTWRKRLKIRYDGMLDDVQARCRLLSTYIAHTASFSRLLDSFTNWLCCCAAIVGFSLSLAFVLKHVSHAFAPHAAAKQNRVPCLLTRMTPTTLAAIVPRPRAAIAPSLRGIHGTGTGTMQTIAMKTTIPDAATTVAQRPL